MSLCRGITEKHGDSRKDNFPPLYVDNGCLIVRLFGEGQRVRNGDNLQFFLEHRTEGRRYQNKYREQSAVWQRSSQPDSPGS